MVKTLRNRNLTLKNIVANNTSESIHGKEYLHVNRDEIKTFH